MMIIFFSVPMLHSHKGVCLVSVLDKITQPKIETNHTVTRTNDVTHFSVITIVFISFLNREK